MSFDLIAVRRDPTANSTMIAQSDKQKPTLLTILALQSTVFETMADFQRKECPIPEKTTSIKQLQKSALHLRAECVEIQTECERIVDALPFYYFFAKWRLWLAKHDVFILGEDDTSLTYFSANKTVRELKKRIHQLVQKELVKLSAVTCKSCEESFGVVGLYDALCELEPENSKPMQNLAKWLMQEKAYEEAAKLLRQLVLKHPGDTHLEFQFIDALLGCKQYAVADAKITELKIRLSSPDYKVRAENMAQHQNDLDRLDELKAECLALQKQFQPALEILKELDKRHPHNDLIKQKIILYMRHKELEEVGDAELTELQKKFLFACPKQVFANLSTYKDSACTSSSLISDLEFWLDTLMAHPKLFSNKKMYRFIQNQIADLIDSKLISKELLMRRVTERQNLLHEKQRFIEARFYELVQNMNQLNDRQIAILKARTVELGQTLNGHDSLHGSIGLVATRTLSKDLLEKLSLNSGYSDDDTKRSLRLLMDRLQSQEESASSCGHRFRLLTKPPQMQRLLLT